jgi:hypothetical protein
MYQLKGYSECGVKGLILLISRINLESALIGPCFLCDYNVKILKLAIMHTVIQNEALNLVSDCHTLKKVHVLQEKRQRSGLKLRDPAFTVVVKTQNE